MQVSQCFQSDLCQALWPTGKIVMAYTWAMAYRLKTTALRGIMSTERNLFPAKNQTLRSYRVYMSPTR